MSGLVLCLPARSGRVVCLLAMLAVLAVATLPAGTALGRDSGSRAPQVPPAPRAVPPTPRAELHLDLERPDDTWHGVTAIADGARGGAARFDGDQSRIDAGSLPVRGDRPFTVEVHLRTTSGAFCTPVMARTDEQVGFSFVMGREPGRVSFEAWSWQRARALSTTRLDDGKWHHLRAAYDPVSTAVLLYVDGAPEAIVELGRGGSPDAQLRLGNNLGAHQPFQGDLDEFRVSAVGPDAEHLARVRPVVPDAEKAAALRAHRQALLPRRTEGLAPGELASWPGRRLEVRRHVTDCLGLFPEPGRGDLAVEVHGQVGRDGITVQRLSWNGFPGERATGWLWRRDPVPAGRRPAVLCPHGHWQHGAVDPVVQARCAAMARLGWTVLAVDSVHVEDIASGVSSIGVMTWHNLRAVDLLRQRDDVDPDRIAVTGASGGGQQTYYLMALDERLAAAAPVVMACYFAEILDDTSAHCSCNHLPRLAAGTDVIEMCAVFAPRPAWFGSVTGDWTQNFPEQGLPELRGLWAHLGAGDRLLARHADEGHNYDRPMREAVYSFLQGVLVPAAGGKQPAEADFAPFPPLRLRALGGPPTGMRADRAALAREHLERRAPVASFHEVAPGLPWQVERAPMEWRGSADLAWRPGTVRGADGVPVPFALRKTEVADPVPWTVVVAGGGRAALLLADPRWLHAAQRPVVVDPRFVGEWRAFAPAWRRNGLLLGRGEGYQAAHDLALVAESLPGAAPVTLVGIGAGGFPAVLAAAISKRVTKVVTDDLGARYEDDGNRLPLLPEFLRLGGFLEVVRRIQGRCELRLGGAVTEVLGGPRRDLCVPLSEQELWKEMLPRSR